MGYSCSSSKSTEISGIRARINLTFGEKKLVWRLEVDRSSGQGFLTKQEYLEKLCAS